MAIHFFYENEHNPFRLSKEVSHKKWIRKVVSLFDIKVKAVNYIFCDDNFLYQLNLTYLQHDTLTDIITFDYTEDRNKGIEGEIYISVERVADNAKELGVAFCDELDRVMIHGILHLVGYRDETEEEEKEMRRLEDECLKMR